MSNNAKSAVNQQGSLQDFLLYNPSETTRRTPLSTMVIQAYLLGALHDGTYTHHRRFRFSQKGMEWLTFLQRLFAKLGHNAWLYREGKTRDVYVLKTLASFLNFQFNPMVLREIAEQQAYVRGFFDAEGGIPHNAADRFYIQLVQKNKRKLEMIKSILAKTGIQIGKIHNPSKRVDPNYWRMYVLASSHEAFIKNIGSWHPRKRDIFKKRKKI